MVRYGYKVYLFQDLQIVCFNMPQVMKVKVKERDPCLEALGVYWTGIPRLKIYVNLSVIKPKFIHYTGTMFLNNFQKVLTFNTTMLDT